MKRLVDVAAAAGTGCEYYRCALPHRFLKERLAAEGVSLERCEAWTGADDPDAALFHGAPVNGSLAVPLARLINQSRRSFWESDDHIPAIPAWSPHSAGITPIDRLGFRECLALATGCVASTERLKKTFGHDEKTTVLPNLIDWDAFHIAPRKPKLRLLWAGGHSHENDLRVVVPALKEARKAYGDRLEIVFAGYCPDWLAADPEVSPRVVGWARTTSYPWFLSELAPDVALCPLSEDPDALPFNECRSAVKWMEYTAAGADVVASDVGPYADNIEHGRTGWLCKPDEWVDAVCGALRFRGTYEGRRAQDMAANVVRTRHSWQHSPAADDWFQAYLKMVG